MKFVEKLWNNFEILNNPPNLQLYTDKQKEKVEEIIYKNVVNFFFKGKKFEKEDEKNISILLDIFYNTIEKNTKQWEKFKSLFNILLNTQPREYIYILPEILEIFNKHPILIKLINNFFQKYKGEKIHLKPIIKYLEKDNIEYLLKEKCYYLVIPYLGDIINKIDDTQINNLIQDFIEAIENEENSFLNNYLETKNKYSESNNIFEILINTWKVKKELIEKLKIIFFKIEEGDNYSHKINFLPNMIKSKIIEEKKLRELFNKYVQEQEPDYLTLSILKEIIENIELNDNENEKLNIFINKIIESCNDISYCYNIILKIKEFLNLNIDKKIKENIRSFLDNTLKYFLDGDWNLKIEANNPSIYYFWKIFTEWYYKEKDKENEMINKLNDAFINLQKLNDSQIRYNIMMDYFLPTWKIKFETFNKIEKDPKKYFQNPEVFRYYLKAYNKYLKEKYNNYYK